MAGELGLEPRMTVPKTGVLPLHHSPAGPASAALSCGGGGQIGQTVFGCNTPAQDNFRRLRRRSKWTLAASETHGYKPRPHFGATPCGPAPTVGVWLSLVEHCVRDAGVGGSNPRTPTILSPTSSDRHPRARPEGRPVRRMASIRTHRMTSHLPRISRRSPPSPAPAAPPRSDAPPPTRSAAAPGPRAAP